MEMFLIIAAIPLLFKSLEVNGNYLKTNNLVKEGYHQPASETFVERKLKEKFGKINEKWGLERIGEEISIVKSQMHSMLQMVELQAVTLQILRDQVTSARTIIQPDVMQNNHNLFGRRYWRRIRKELQSIRECSCRPISSIVSEAVAEIEKSVVFKNNSTVTKSFPEIDGKDLSSSGGCVSDIANDVNISIHEIGRNLGSNGVFEFPNSSDESNKSMTKVTPNETNRSMTNATPIETNQLLNTTIGILEKKRKENKSVPLKSLNQIDGNLESYDVEIDLTRGIVHGKLATGLTWLLHPSWPKRKSDRTSQCRLQSVMKLSFSPPTKKAEDLKSEKTKHERRKLLIDLWVQKPHKWIFNIGDSSSNDGLSGDGSTQQNDCEAEGYGDTLKVYKSDKAQDPFKKLLYEKRGFLKHRITFIVSDQSLFWNNHDGNINTLNDSTLFALNNQPDSQGHINLDIYLALNRVISGDYRSGQGLCRAALKWLP